MAGGSCALTIEDLSDKQLLQRLADGADQAAFAALVHRYGKLVLGVGRRLLGAGPDMEAVFQATFVVLARKPGAVRKQVSVAGWLFGVAHQMALQLQANRADPPNRTQRCDLGDMLEEELQALPAPWRDALLLCHIDGLDTATAAQRLEWPHDTLRGRLRSGRDLLRRRLESRGVNLSAMGLVIALAEQAGSAAPTLLLRSTLACASSATLPIAVAALAASAAAALAPSKLQFA